MSFKGKFKGNLSPNLQYVSFLMNSMPNGCKCAATNVSRNGIIITRVRRWRWNLLMYICIWCGNMALARDKQDLHLSML